jgi:hypothetical protein
MELKTFLGVNGQVEILEYKELLIKYYKGLVNSIYKLLPLYEGRRYRTSDIFHNKEDAYKYFQVYLSNLLVELHGNSQLFFCSDNSIKLISILKGMIQEISIDEHTKVKRLTMECINLCKKIIKEIEEMG